MAGAVSEGAGVGDGGWGRGGAAGLDAAVPSNWGFGWRGGARKGSEPSGHNEQAESLTASPCFGDVKMEPKRPDYHNPDKGW